MSLPSPSHPCTCHTNSLVLHPGCGITAGYGICNDGSCQDLSLDRCALPSSLASGTRHNGVYDLSQSTCPCILLSVGTFIVSTSEEELFAMDRPYAHVSLPPESSPVGNVKGSALVQTAAFNRH